MSRRDPGIDPHLDLKIGLFFLAAVLGLAGIILGRPLLIFAAMVVIGAGLLLRFLRPRGGVEGRGAASGDGGRGGASDGGASDGGASDGGASDGGASDGGASDGGASDGGASDGGASDGGASDGGGRDVAPGDDGRDVPRGGDASRSIGTDASDEAGSDGA